MNTMIRKGKTQFYGDYTFKYGLSRSGHFTLKEAEILAIYGHTFTALAEGTIQPTNNDEQHFVEQINDEAECSLYAAKLWKKYLNIIDKNKICHSFSKSHVRTSQDLGNEYSFAE